LFPLLSNIFINCIVQKVKEAGDGGELGCLRIPLLLFEDDMVLIADGQEVERIVGKVTNDVKSGDNRPK
jgi:hypothetical protein